MCGGAVCGSPMGLKPYKALEKGARWLVGHLNPLLLLRAKLCRAAGNASVGVTPPWQGKFQGTRGDFQSMMPWQGRVSTSHSLISGCLSAKGNGLRPV